MFSAKKKILCASLVAALGFTTVAHAQLAELFFGQMLAGGVKLLIEGAGTLLYLTYKAGEAVYEKASKADYPKLKPGINCIGLGNNSQDTWTLIVPNKNDKAEKKNQDYRKISKQTGNIKVYTVVDKSKGTGKSGQPKVYFLGNLAGDKRKQIEIKPGDEFILYADVPGIDLGLGKIKYGDLDLEFRLMDSNGKVIKYDMFRTSSSKAPIIFNPKISYVSAAEKAINRTQYDVKYQLDGKEQNAVMVQYTITSDSVPE